MTRRPGQVPPETLGVGSAALTGVWIAVGWVLHVDTRVYQLLGIPFIAGFQLLVRRRPVSDLWVRDGDAFRIDGRGKVIACVLVVSPLVVGTQPFGDLVLSLLLVHVTIGVPLSLAWRRSGNLTPSAVSHAVIDAVRDGLSV